jgi:hypothetical protein
LVWGIRPISKFMASKQHQLAQNNIFSMETPYTVLLFGHVTGVRNQHSSVVQRVKKERGRSKKTNYS